MKSKMTKAQRLRYIQSIEAMEVLSPEAQKISRNAEDVADMRDRLKYFADMYYCLRGQLHKHISYYQGKSYIMNEWEVERMISAIERKWTQTLVVLGTVAVALFLTPSFSSEPVDIPKLFLLVPFSAILFGLIAS
jgi:hypothetical protein